MKKINFLAFTALLCGYFGVQATEEATTTATLSQGTAVSSTNGQIAAAAAEFFSNQTNTLSQTIAVQSGVSAEQLAAKTYTFNYVTSDQTSDGGIQLAFSQYNFNLSEQATSLSDIAQGIESALFSDSSAGASQAATALPIRYIYKTDGTLLSSLSGLSSINSSWMPVAGSTAPAFFVSASSDLLSSDLMNLAAVSNGVITVEKPEAVIADAAVESIGVSTNVPLTAAQ